MEKESFSHNKPDEMDPVILLEKGMTFLRNSRRILLLFAILGLALGFGRYLVSPKIYKSRSLLHSVVLTNQEEIEMIQHWNQLRGRGDLHQLAQTMNMDVEILKKLKKIDAEEIQKLYIQNNPNGFAIDIWVTDTAVMDELQAGIVYGLGNSLYVKERVDTRKARFVEMIRNVSYELAKLESTKATVDSVIRNSKTGASPFLLDISSLNSQWIGLHEKLLSYQEELKFANAVQVLQQFYKPTKPIGPSLLKNLVFGLIGGLFLGYLVALYFQLRKKLEGRRSVRYYQNS